MPRNLPKFLPRLGRPVAGLMLISLLAGCAGMAQSRLNPMNWFAPRAASQTEVMLQAPADTRALIETIVDVQIEKTPSGALLRATGRAATQGYWQADLVVGTADEDGNLPVEFRVIPAPPGAAVSTPRSREITAAVSLRADTLASARRITVQGGQNALSARP
jgi:hypothetical protein